jgi:hypothetical protein
LCPTFVVMGDSSYVSCDDHIGPNKIQNEV